ncbi:MAG TPA: hypothetical protein V6D28_10025 [Leptolyngbyaceae cyanobacterium]
MTDFDTTPASSYQQLAQAYRHSSIVEQKIIQLFSVIYEPISRTLFLDCLNYIGVRHEDGKTFTNLTLKPYIDKLLATNLLIQESGQGPQCHPLLTEIATRDAAVKTGWFETLAATVQEKLPIMLHYTNGPRYFHNQRQLFREIRIGIYRQNLSSINQILEEYHKYSNKKDKISLDQIFDQVCNRPFDADWFRTLPLELYESAISSILLNSALKCRPAQEAFALLKAECAIPSGHGSDYLQMLLAEQLLLRGCIEEAQQTLERISDNSQGNAVALWGWLYFLSGENEQAINTYTTALKALKKAKSKTKIYFNTIAGIFFILALLKDGSSERLREAEEYTNFIARQSFDHWLKSTYALLQILLQVQLGNIAQKQSIINAYIPSIAEATSLETLFCYLCFYWVDADKAKKRLPKSVEYLYQQAFISGYRWLAIESGELLLRFKFRTIYQLQIQTLLADNHIQSIVDLIHPQEPWELCLNALANLQKEPLAPIKSETEQRLAWFVTFYPSQCLLQPREQKLSKGGWGKGRLLSLKCLSNNLGEFDYFTPQDIRVCGYIETYNDASYGYYGKTDYRFNHKAICALVGHPLVFWEDAPTTRVEIVKGEPELIVKKVKKDRITLEISPKVSSTQDFLAIKETPTRIKIIEITPEHQRIIDIIGQQNRLEVPAIAQERVLAAIKAVSSIVTVHSDIGGGLLVAEEVPAQTIPHIHLLPAGIGLKVALLSRPFAQGGSYYRPGTGGETVIAEIDGKRLQTKRNLQKEKQLADAVITACPTLTRMEEEDGEWLIEDSENCLELLLELQALGDKVVLEWPEGEKLRINPHFSQNLRSPTTKPLLDKGFSVQTTSFHIQQCVNWYQFKIIRN